MQDKQNEKSGHLGLSIGLACLVVGLWGFSHRLYSTLLPSIAAAAPLDSREIDLARASLAIGYALMTLPAAFVMRNFGYKIGIVFGLGMLGVGMFLFYPAIEKHSLLFFIMATAVTGSGLALMEVATTALVVFLGSRKSAIWRSNLIQSLVPIGALAGLLLGEHILGGAASSDHFVHALVQPLFTLGAAIFGLMFIIDLVDFPPVAGELVASTDSTLKSFALPFKHRTFCHSLVGLFLCLGAQVTLSLYVTRYNDTGVLTAPIPQNTVLAWGMLAFAAGRLIGPLATRWMDDMAALALFSIGGVICSFVMVLSHGPVAVAALLGLAFFLAFQFPTIFAYTLRNMGSMSKSAAAVMIFTAFSGSAVLALITMLVTSQALSLAMTLPGICSAGVLLYALSMRRASGSPAPAAPPIYAEGADRPAVRPS